MRRTVLAVLMLCALSLLAQKPETTVTEPPQSLAHVSNSFALTVNASMRDAAPLFGPQGERVWAGDDWDPRFVFPIPARDVEGAVFTIHHGEHTAVWVNTRFDPAGGRMQYVYVLGDLLVATIDVRLHAIDATHTKVDVRYVRTALRPRRMSTLLRWESTTASRDRSGRMRSTPIWSGAQARGNTPLCTTCGCCVEVGACRDR